MNSAGMKYVIVAVVAVAFFLRLWGTMERTELVGDESSVIAATENYIQKGHFEPIMWMHPPLPYLLTGASVALFGNNPYGWRIKSVLFGSMSVTLLFLLGKELFPDARRALLAALFLAIEPIHIQLSRTTSAEVTSMFFFLLAVYVTTLFLKGRVRSPLIAGFALGMALADRWYYLPSLAVLIGVVLLFLRREKKLTWLRVAHLASVYVVLPLTIYLLTYVLWFQRGTTIMEFIQMQIDAYRELQMITLNSFEVPFMRRLPSSPWSWFIKPQAAGMQIEARGEWARYYLLMGNLPVWILTFPALLFALYQWMKNRVWQEGLLIALFLSTYGQFIVVQRPIFLYASLVVLPVVYLLVASPLISLLTTMKDTGRYFIILNAAIAAWGLYLYPPTVGLLLPSAFYWPVLSLAGLP